MKQTWRKSALQYHTQRFNLWYHKHSGWVVFLIVYFVVLVTFLVTWKSMHGAWK